MVKISITDPRENEPTYRRLGQKPIRIGNNPESDIHIKDLEDNSIEIGFTKYDSVYVRSLNPNYPAKVQPKNRPSFEFQDIIFDPKFKIILYKGVKDSDLEGLTEREKDEIFDQAKVTVQIQ